MNNIKLIRFIIMIVIIVIMGSLAYAKRQESYKNERLMKDKEIELLNEFFEGYTDYRIKEIPEGYSFRIDEKSAIPYPEYFFAKEQDTVVSESSVCYVFSSEEKAINALNELKGEGGEDFIMVSKTIFCEKAEDKQYRRILEKAKKLFSSEE